MEEKNKIKLQQAIQHLPEFAPDARLWDNIQANLDFDKALTRTVPLLPEFEPAAKMRQQVEEKLILEKRVQKPGKVISLIRYAAGIAACISLIVIGWLSFPKNHTDDATISYSQENSYEEPVINTSGANAKHNQALDFISASCESKLEICQSPEFKELKLQLDALEKEITDLKKAQELYGQDPELTKVQIKIENLKSKLTKALIQLILT